MKPDVPSQTAERVALTRAIESLRSENHRICSDSYAQYYLTGKMKRIFQHWLLHKMYGAMSTWRFPGLVEAVFIRNRFMMIL